MEKGSSLPCHLHIFSPGPPWSAAGCWGGRNRPLSGQSVSCASPPRAGGPNWVFLSPTDHLGAQDSALQFCHLLLKQDVAGGDAPVIQGDHHQRSPAITSDHQRSPPRSPPAGPPERRRARRSARRFAQKPIMGPNQAVPRGLGADNCGQKLMRRLMCCLGDADPAPTEAVGRRPPANRRRGRGRKP